jgi:hypothetical protein
MVFKHWRRLKTVDVIFPATIGVYAFWPWWAMHGGPPPPKDLGTVVMGVLGWFGTSKALEAGKTREPKAKAGDDDEDVAPEDNQPHG